MEYESSTRAICEALGIELREIPDWSCCGSTPAHTVDHVLSSALASRNLELVEQMGLDSVITPCPSCLTNLKTAEHRMRNPEFMGEVNKLLDRPVKNTVKVKSVLQVIVEDLGPEKIKEKVVKPLTGLKLAPYYGCIMNRPPEVMEFDDCENPVAMDKILEALGATVVDFPLKVECCGASFGVARKDVVARLSGRLLDMAEDKGAMAVSTACPLCQMNLDLRQGQINTITKSRHDMPVFYYTQLIGLALGVDERKLGLNKLCVNPRKALREAQRATAEAAK
jgi:heterodisulfide reductase subunit B